jgi:hypothetical protein
MPRWRPISIYLIFPQLLLKYYHYKNLLTHLRVFLLFWYKRLLNWLHPHKPILHITWWTYCTRRSIWVKATAMKIIFCILWICGIACFRVHYLICDRHSVKENSVSEINNHTDSTESILLYKTVSSVTMSVYNSTTARPILIKISIQGL